jgi:hypothetical protein
VIGLSNQAASLSTYDLTRDPEGKGDDIYIGKTI